MRYLISIVLITLLSFPLAAQTWEDAETAYKRGDLLAAISMYKTLAKTGDARAQHLVGLFYKNGNGVPRDYSKAEKWIRMSAIGNFPLAQNSLGMLYHFGQGVKQDYFEALKWYKLSVTNAAKGGFLKHVSNALHNLGVLYASGQGAPQDFVQAHMWANISSAYGGDGSAKLLTKLASEMTREQIAESQKLAREWMANYQK